MQQGARQCEPLALAARQIGRARRDLRVEPADRTHEIGEATTLERRPQGRFVGIRGGKAQIVGHGSREDIARRFHHGHKTAHGVGGKIAHVDTVDLDSSDISRIGPRQDARERRFARSAFARYADKRRARSEEIDIGKHVAAAVVGIPHAFASYAAA